MPNEASLELAADGWRGWGRFVRAEKEEEEERAVFASLGRQHAFMAGTQKQPSGSAGTGGGSVTHSPERLRGATQDLFELLERVQCSRLDDQRCVLPAYFSQPPTRHAHFALHFITIYFGLLPN
ncbi:hypothetical protein AWZ03_007493 [Drosophila navojoa]|uniref:Uncharacterized protein n=1 Tax=Drosophila navojoa TaxID=7232 RepID=A0A484BBK4_DRONA|nr:hypothetical protein AWZ03_007493 [Drosophila navojoa]